jgi:hypothetical protein
MQEGRLQLEHTQPRFLTLSLTHTQTHTHTLGLSPPAPHTCLSPLLPLMALPPPHPPHCLVESLGHSFQVPRNREGQADRLWGNSRAHSELLHIPAMEVEREERWGRGRGGVEEGGEVWWMGEEARRREGMLEEHHRSEDQILPQLLP